MGETSIEWADFTYNPWIGCTKVSPGCANCYAERDMDLRRGRVKWGKGNQRSRTKTYTQVRKWDRQAAHALRNQLYPEPRRPRVFCASLADWLDPEVPVEWLADLLALIAETPHLDWLMLTKRPENWRLRLSKALGCADPHVERSDEWEWLDEWLCGTAPSHVWIGTTVEDQQRANERIPELLKIPARVRFLSCEPLLEPVDLLCVASGFMDGSHIHWVICGGESGPKARPMHPAWARSLRDQCQAVGVAFFMKQMGGTRDKRHNLEDLPADLRLRRAPR